MAFSQGGIQRGSREGTRVRQAAKGESKLSKTVNLSASAGKEDIFDGSMAYIEYPPLRINPKFELFNLHRLSCLTHLTREIITLPPTIDPCH